MPQESKPSSIFKWASTGSVVSMDSVKQALGWTAEKPMFQKMNWLFQTITQHLSHLNSHGIGVWDAATDYASGGVARGSDGKLYTRNSSGIGGGEPSVTPGNWTLLVYTVASSGEAQALTANDKIMTPLQVKNSFKGANQSLSANGFQKFPGGLIMQWGVASVTSAGAGTTGEAAVVFPVTFPTAARNISLAVIQPSGAMNGTVGAYFRSLTTSGVNIGLDHLSIDPASVTLDVHWQAWGY